jgi:hypothetical protein
MHKSLLGVALAGALVALGGCDTTSAIAGYSPSTANVLAFQTALKSSGRTARVGDFTAAPDVEKPTCRMAGTLDVSPGKELEQYVKDALQTELFTAQVYDVASPVVINGRLDRATVDTFGSGSWTLGLQVTSSVDPVGYHVEATRAFKSSYSAMAACQNATNAFAPTVQDLIAQVVNNPGFARLVGKS